MKTTNSKPEISIYFSKRESLLSSNSEIIKQLQERLKAKRFRPQEGDSTKLAYMRVYLQAIQVQNSILKDTELDEIKNEIEELKEALKSQSKK
ncbi:hypothetical protein [Methanosarcina sp. WWM596]|jgi:hypothetical protein|uniref:hypothetical protein n=1 Tax=Methanosarcina sp. WWM596 TaxID=1434103 RepID=UPI000615C255|nr:hypothetical protein [Methanosarcina sp. WWM596]AKB19540.1 hypothetical protein MSWHS_2677 [Methanosarcina sp. WWM596]